MIISYYKVYIVGQRIAGGDSTDKFDSRKLYVQVFDKIRKYIFTNQLGAGDRLPTEFEMCEMFGVSRNVLRESVKALELMGIVKSSPGIGIVVQEYNMNFMFQQMFYSLVSDSSALLREILEIRRALEIGFAEAAYSSVSVADIEELKDIVDCMGAKLLRGSLFREEDTMFHLKLFEHVDNKMLNAIFLAAWDADSNFNVEKKEDYFTVYRNHADMVDALEAKDYQRFLKALELHFSKEEYIKTKPGRGKLSTD